ncbi:hypothetical protein SAMN04487965_2992 [Microbulbifer donghaiensis]|uniref:Uncharacterized protein n=1 Tax=Microbulbifer donghaiensis TaxID=494016 RepID=A0A1M5FP62_9GAMM|nr:hypothetical protein [Microbulbifer donghaiensis]SHF93286.1 hypothetical protein SAMN04487965_2992 [Microbulbifer donghaiensis]
MKKIIPFAIALSAFISGCNSAHVKEQSDGSLHGGIITIKGQSKVYAEVTINEGKIVDVTQVESVLNPEKTVAFEFSETENGTMLSVKNPFELPIKYHINMVDYSGNFHKTSSCPVMAGGGAFESWPHPIPQLVISNFRFLGENQAFTCTY